MMKKGIREYHPNGMLKYKLIFYNNGCKEYEQYYDEEGNDHNENGPDYQEWYGNGYLCGKTYSVHGKFHNISGPASIWRLSNGKVESKSYYNNHSGFNKLNWLNKIKHI